MKELRRRADPNPSDALPAFTKPFEETVAPRPRIIPEKILDRRARSLKRLIRRPVAGSAFLVRIFDDLTFDELRDFLR